MPVDILHSLSPQNLSIHSFFNDSFAFSSWILPFIQEQMISEAWPSSPSPEETTRYTGSLGLKFRVQHWCFPGCVLNSIWNETCSPYSFIGSSCSLCSWVEGCFACHCYHCALEDGGPWRTEESTAFGWAADGTNLSWIKFPLGARHLVILFTWGNWILTNTHGVIIIMSNL